MIIVRDRQRWVRVKTKRAGTVVDIVGEWKGAPAGTLLYSNVSSTRRARGKITARELRRNWRLVSCEHKDLADECLFCRCAFHGTEGCTCAGVRP